MRKPSQKDYITVSKRAMAKYIERKSIFISYVKHAETADEANSFINEIKAGHRDARHSVYAYRIMSENGTIYQKYSDDGEPGGTAGLPTLSAITKKGLSNTVIVTARYFGGILLGASGLTNAYGKSASKVLESAGFAAMKYCHEVLITAGYHLLGKIISMCSSAGIKISKTDYFEEAAITVVIETDRYDSFESSLLEITNADVTIKNLGSTFHPFNFE